MYTTILFEVKFMYYIFYIGRRQVAFSNVYLKPSIDDLNVLWRGRMMYDVSRSGPEKNIFVRGIILWTLHDLAGERNLN